MRMLSTLSGWPPQGGAGPFDTRKAAFEKSPELITLRRVNRIVGTRIDITCMFNHEVVTFRFFAPNKGMAENIAAVLSSNEGRSLVDLGLLAVAESEA